ncbi:MAG: hypothetical protein HY904_23805 [Deltaproteobacteria bacterium]|nr:hypothetical protein [Deltaproteobacteria bacterium]
MQVTSAAAILERAFPRESRRRSWAVRVVMAAWLAATVGLAAFNTGTLRPQSQGSQGGPPASSGS